MTGLAVVVAPAGVALVGVRDALADWSGAGLVQPFCWVSADQVTRDGSWALLVGPDGLTPVNLQAYVSQAPVDELVLSVLVPSAEGAEPVGADIENLVWGQLSASRNNVRVVPMRVVVARPGGGGTPQAQVGRAGWHNIVVAPELSSDPTVGVSPLPPSDDPVDIGRYAAVVVAGLCGLWTGATASPIGAEAPSNGRFARLARAHMVWADGTELASEIEQKALSLAVVPRPTTTMGTTAYIDDWQQAADTAAQQVLYAHAAELKSGREAPPAVQVTSLGVGAALKMLWGFLWKSLKNAPTSWARAMLGKAQSEIANRVHSHVFGSNSAYQVVAGLRTASPLELTRAVGEMSNRLDAVAQNVLEPTSTFPGLWSDFVNGALTLMDAGQRSPNVPPVRVGTEPAVVRTADAVAPPPEATFAVDARIPGIQGTHRLSPVDHVGLQAVQQTIDMARANDPANPFLGEATARLQEFRMAYGGSYASRTGAWLGDLLGNLINEVEALATALQQAGDTSNDDGILAQQKRLGDWMRILALLLLVGIGIVIGLGVAEILTLWTAIAAGAGVVVAWLIATTVVFLRGQRALFAALNRREEAAGRAQVNFVNLRYAVRDLRRTSDAYNQFLSWSRVVSAFVHQPLGAREGDGSTGGTGMAGLPENLSVGTLRQPPVEQDAVASEVRRRYFSVGWLGAPWRAVFADAARRIGPGASDLVAQPERLFAERPGVPESLLDAWTHALETGGVGTAPGRPAREFVQRELLSSGDDRFLRGAHVQDVNGRDVPLPTFFGGIANQAVRGQRFDGRVLTATASTDATASGVAQVFVQPLPVLGRAVARVELSPEIPAEHFRLESGAAAPRQSAGTDAIGDLM